MLAWLDVIATWTQAAKMTMAWWSRSESFGGDGGGGGGAAGEARSRTGMTLPLAPAAHPVLPDDSSVAPGNMPRQNVLVDLLPFNSGACERLRNAV